MADALLLQHQPSPLWLFAYGSLIWNRNFESQLAQRAVAAGWHRSFCFVVKRWRGTMDTPGLMMALDRGGSCVGIAYKLPDHDHKAQLIRLLEREVDAKVATNVPKWIWVTTGEGRIKVLAFVAARDGPAYAGRQSAEAVARVIARAAGNWGSSAAYLQRTVSKLEEHGIRDRNLWRLQELVAREIVALPTGAHQNFLPSAGPSIRTPD
ncbi:gamma-glutamylcyclotransferase [Poseidonocella sp. HB161398]|uniref:gamma-glutamylcyclotransferase n=1 Tax=Poseidonocella sp. HB161398 TaxID=2320855 RepID=UPI00197DA37B|nr:gamma-glutamylcyclotransferase [Poseidonocella sp. HB161398]